MARAPRTGRLGEAAFEGLCDHAGLVPNRAGDDQGGWDYFVEFPKAPSDLPADQAPKALNALVQVKTTYDVSKKSARVKLSNALRFAQDANPCFTVLLKYRKNEDRPYLVYFRHFWSAEIEQTLAASRAASVAGRPLRHEHLTTAFTDDDAVEPQDLLARMEAVLSALEPDYAARKKRLADTAGAETRKLKVTATFGPGFTAEALLQTMVGAGGPLPVSAFHVVEERFGVSAPRHDLSGAGNLSVLAQSKALDLTFSHRETGEAIRLPAEAFYASIPGPKRLLQRLRIKADFVELTSDIDTFGAITAGYDAREVTTIQRARTIVQLFAWLNSGAVDYTLDAGVGKRLDGVCDLDPARRDGRWAVLDRVLTALFSVFPAGQWPEIQGFTLGSLFQEIEILLQTAGVLTGESVQLTFDDINPDFPLETLPGMDFLLGCVNLDMATVTLFAIYLAPIRKADIGDGKAVITIDTPKILRRQVFRGTMADNWTRMREQLAEARAGCPSRILAMDLPETPPTPSAAAYCGDFYLS